MYLVVLVNIKLIFKLFSQLYTCS